MAELRVKAYEIINNIKKINDVMDENNKEWTLICKILSGDKDALIEILKSPEIKRIHSLGDSRLSNLKAIKEIDPDIVTMYIKPVPKPQIQNIIKYCDISMNTSLETIKALNEEAKKQGKTHRIVIMIEMGELREGVVRENIMGFYKDVFELDNISIEGIGTNLGCMYGVEPTYDKLVQLSLYKQLLESMFKRELPLISGGSSITLPLIEAKKIPDAMNHFRVGEAAFIGTSPLDNQLWRDLSGETFDYTANIVELEEKEYVPDGVIGEGNIGHSEEFDKNPEDTTYKAIVDFGLLDVDTDELKPSDPSVKFIGTTSDMTVYDLGTNKTKSGEWKYKVGDKIIFKPTYMGIARLMNSKFISKKVLDE